MKQGGGIQLAFLSIIFDLRSCTLLHSTAYFHFRIGKEKFTFSQLLLPGWFGL